MFIFPISHEDTTLRTVPYVSFAIIGICILVFIGQVVVFSSSKADRMLMDAILYYQTRSHYLELPETLADRLLIPIDEMEDMMEELRSQFPEMDDQDFDYVPEEFRRASPRLAIPDSETVDEEQRYLDDLVADALAKSGMNFFDKWGFIAASPSFATLVTSMFIHVGFWHLLGNMIFLYLTGPVIESRYGMIFFGLFYIVGGFVSTLMFGLHYPNLTIPLIGASGAISAVLGAFLIKYWRTKIKFFYMFFIFIRGTFQLPTWVYFPIWFLMQLLMARLMDSLNPDGGAGVAYWAHIWGFVFGMAVVTILAFTGLEKKLCLVDLESETPEMKILSEARKQERLSRPSWALETLKKGIAQFPDHPELLHRYWLLAQIQKSTDDIIAAGTKLMRLDLANKEPKMAFLRWKEMWEACSDLKLSLSFVNNLAFTLIKQEFYYEAEEILNKSFQVTPNAPFHNLIRMVELSVLMKSAIGLKFVEAAEKLPENVGLEHKKLMDFKAQLVQIKKLNPSVSDEGIPLSQGEANITESIVEKNIHSLNVFETVPQKFGPEEFHVLIQNQHKKQIQYNHIKALAVGVIREDGAKPILLVDLLFDPIGEVLEKHRVLRFNSSQFNPVQFITNAPNANAAYKRIIGALLKKSGADPLPDQQAVQGNPYPIYSSVAHFEKATYY